MITVPREGQYNMHNTEFCPHANFVDFIQPKYYRGLLKHFPSDDLFKDEFPEFHFKTTIQNNQPLSNKLSVSELSRYQKLIDLNQENIICGFYFPEALSGFDIPSQKQQMKELPAFNDLSSPESTVVPLLLNLRVSA